MDKFLHKIYYDPKSPVAYAGAGTMYYYAKKIKPSITFRQITQFLEKQHTATIHKQAPRKFPRNKVIPIGKDSHWQADLMDMRKLEQQNAGYNYVLNVIDVLSKYGFSEPVKRKTADQVAKAFQTILTRSGRKPWFLYVDKGREFKGVFKKFVHDQDINLFASESPDVKASNAERYNRTLKTRLYK
jgi:hypothetical protein